MAILLGVRPDIAEAARLPMFWVKLAFPAALLAGALLAVFRLSRPGASLGRVPAAIAAPVLAMWLLAAVVLLSAAPGERAQLVFGDSGATCPFIIALLSVPLFGAPLWAMKGLAPTRLALAGAAAGLLSGAGGALVYALYCTEMAAPFIGIWYLLGMLIPAARRRTDRAARAALVVAVPNMIKEEIHMSAFRLQCCPVVVDVIALALPPTGWSP